MKICICTTPIRPRPTPFPPFGSMAIIQSLRHIGEQAAFYHIDYWRPTHDEIVAYFTEHQFDVVGISAVVSTAYAYTKYLSELIRRVSPNTVILVGGNLAASAEILLRKCQVDFCVAGDGELIIQELITALREGRRNYDRLRMIKGICFLDERGQFYFSGYGARPSAEAIEWPDYDILEADGSLAHYVSEATDVFDGVVSPQQTEGKRFATVITTKGCVARCTFCHRWEKGFRALPVDGIVEHVQQLKDRYNVGFVSIGDENFGSDRKLTKELVTRLGELGIVWRASGVRARTVDAETLKYWKANGCASAFYGIESGSQTMLDVMEKNVTVQMNINALRYTHEAGVFTIVQLVLGMPGETDDTIRETIEFLKTVVSYLHVDRSIPPSALIGINYAQALPGTPLYEHARQHGLIGQQVDDEEKYLIRISDTDAYSTDHFINYTGQPLLKVLMWRRWMCAEVDAHYMQQALGITLSLTQVVRHFGRIFTRVVARRLGLERFRPLATGRHVQDLLIHGRQELRNGAEELEKDAASDSMVRHLYSTNGYFNIQPSYFSPLFLNPFSRRWFYPLLAAGVAVSSTDSPAQAVKLVAQHLRWSLTRRFRSSPKLPDRSLRKLVVIQPMSGPRGEDMTIPLRLGR